MLWTIQNLSTPVAGIEKEKIATGIECPLVNDILVPSWCPIVVEFSLTMT